MCIANVTQDAQVVHGWLTYKGHSRSKLSWTLLPSLTLPCTTGRDTAGWRAHVEGMGRWKRWRVCSSLANKAGIEDTSPSAAGHRDGLTELPHVKHDLERLQAGHSPKNLNPLFPSSPTPSSDARKSLLGLVWYTARATTSSNFSSHLRDCREKFPDISLGFPRTYT